MSFDGHGRNVEGIQLWETREAVKIGLIPHIFEEARLEHPWFPGRDG